MKKFFSLLASVLLAFTMILLPAACGEKDNDDGGNTPPAAELNQAPELQDGQVLFTIYAKDQNGDAVKGVKLQACTDTGCLNPVTTDDEGKAYYAANPSDGYEVKIFEFNGIPEGYTYADTEPEKYPMTATTATTITFTLTKAN